MVLVIVYTYSDTQEIVDLLKKAGADVSLSNDQISAIETSCSKDEFKKACESALGTTDIVVYWGGEVIYENILPENQYDVRTYICHCYCHDDEI